MDYTDLVRNGKWWNLTVGCKRYSRALDRIQVVLYLVPGLHARTDFSLDYARLAFLRTHTRRQLKCKVCLICSQGGSAS